MEVQFSSIFLSIELSMKETHEQLSKDLSEVQEIRKSLEEKLAKLEEEKQVGKQHLSVSFLPLGAIYVSSTSYCFFM
jgi:hypothetical protein